MHAWIFRVHEVKSASKGLLVLCRPPCIQHRNILSQVHSNILKGLVRIIIIYYYYLLLIHVYTGDLPATAVDVMGGPVITKY